MELFCIQTLVVVTRISTGVKIYRTIYQKKKKKFLLCDHLKNKTFLFEELKNLVPCAPTPEHSKGVEVQEQIPCPTPSVCPAPPPTPGGAILHWEMQSARPGWLWPTSPGKRSLQSPELRKLDQPQKATVL